MQLSESLGQQEIHHFSHEHPLKLAEIKHDDDEILCSACRKRCSGQTYFCSSSSSCEFFLHDSCFNLIRNIRHPFQPHHPLTLYSPIQHHSEQFCKVCCCKCYGFTYSCNYCKSFWMDVQCPLMISSIKYEGHCHNILFIDAPYPRKVRSYSMEVSRCIACDTYIRDPWFRCVECDLYIHFECGPLPCSITNEKDHPCPLKLTVSPVIVEGGDKDRDWFVCDVCEEERDPRLPVYYCSNNCAYIAEVKCVISKIRLSLSGEHGEVELRSAIFPHKAGKVICKGIVKGIELTYEHIEDSFPDEDQIKARDTDIAGLDNAVAGYRRQLKDIAGLENIVLWYRRQRDDIMENKEMDFSGSNEDYTKFIAFLNKLERSTQMLQYLPEGFNGYLTAVLPFLWGNSALADDIIMVLVRGKKKNFVNVGDYSVSSDLAPILEDLCTKHGDITPKSASLRSTEMNFFVSSLCETIRGMCTTRVADVSRTKLFSWWRCLKALQSEGFKVEFALDRLERVVGAYYALQVEENVKWDSEQIHEEIEKVCQRIKQLEEDLVAEKAKLVALEDRCRRIVEPQKPGSSGRLVDYFKEAAELRWMMAGEGLL